MNITKKEYKVSATCKCNDCPRRIENDGNIYCAKCWFKRAFEAGLTIVITN